MTRDGEQHGKARQDLIVAARDAVADAPALADAAAALAAALDTDYTLARVALYHCPATAGADLVLEALWSRRPTRIGPGTRLSPKATVYPEVVSRNRPVASSEVAGPFLSDVLRQEGVRSWIAVPLRRGWVIEAVVVFASSVARRIGDADIAFFERLGAELEGPMLALLDADD